MITNEQMNKLRDVEIDLLRQFIDVCNKLNLSYFVVQGTLLGTVRHKGFIPWDDDIDVGMLREDYEIFLKEAPKYLENKYFVQSHLSDPQYVQSFAKLRNSETTFIETTARELKINHGIYIDIFPFDYYPENRLKEINFEIRKFLLRFRIREVYYTSSIDNKSVSELVKRMITKFSCLFYPSIEYALKKQKSLFTSEKESPRMVNNGSPWGKRERIKRAWIDETTTLRFEGIDVSVPVGYKEYLSAVYGDYMTLPPEEDRIPHHFADIIDTEKPYSCYIK